MLKDKIVEIAKRDFDEMVTNTAQPEKYISWSWIWAMRFARQYVTPFECQETYDKIYNYAFEYFKYLKATIERGVLLSKEIK